MRLYLLAWISLLACSETAPSQAPADQVSIPSSRVYDSESGAMAEFSEDGTTIAFRGFGAEHTLTLPDSLVGVPVTKGRAFSEGHFAVWRGRTVGRLVDDAWQLFEMPTDVKGVVSTPGKPLLVHGCQPSETPFDVALAQSDSKSMAVGISCSIID